MKNKYKHIFIDLTILILYLASAAYGDTARYMARDSSQLALHPLDWQGVSTTRKLINLNGQWFALFGEEEQWQKVTVPGATCFEGPVVFRRYFYPDSSFSGRQFRLVALGINYECQIFINKKFVGNHKGGFTSFTINIEPGIIRPGSKNEILIKVNTRLDVRDTLPVKHWQFGKKNYGGITRDIFLLALPVIAIDEVKAVSSLNSDNTAAQIEISIDVRKSSVFRDFKNRLNSHEKRELNWRAELWENERPIQKSTTRAIPSGNAIICSSRLVFELRNPKIWTPTSPFLYQLKLYLNRDKILIDEISLSFGIRELNIENQNFLLNKKLLKLKGINWHEYAQIQYEYQNYNSLKKQILLLKALGANCVRVVGQTPHPYFSQLCSQYGLLLMQELPIWSVPGSILLRKSNTELAQLMLKEMINRDQNQASVLAWGIGGDFEARNPGTLQFTADLCEHVHRFDNRPCYLVVSSPDSNLFNWPADIICLEFLNTDINELSRTSARWLSANSRQLKIISFGYALNQSGIHRFSPIQKETLQSYRLASTLTIIQKMPGLAGFFVMSLTDWESRFPILSFGAENNPSRLSFGLMNAPDQKRFSFRVTQSCLMGDRKKSVSLTPEPGEQPDIFILISLLLILLFLFVYKRNRRIRINISRSLFHPHGFFTDIRENRKFPVFDSIFILIIVSGTLSVITSSIAFYLRSDLTTDKILNLLINGAEIKTGVIRISWSPELALICFFILTILLIHLAAIFIKFLAIMVSRRLCISQCITFSCWTTSIFIFLLPLAILFYRLLVTTDIGAPLPAVIGLFILWHFLRFIKGMKALYFIPLRKILLFFGGINIIFWGCLILYLQHINAIIDYLRMYL